MKKRGRLGLAVAVLLAGLLGAAGTAWAHGAGSILFPYVTTESGRFTFITIANSGICGDIASPISSLYYVYGYKTTTSLSPMTTGGQQQGGLHALRRRGVDDAGRHAHL